MIVKEASIERDLVSSAGASYVRIAVTDHTRPLNEAVDRFIVAVSGVEPVFLEKNQAIGYAETRARLRTGEIRIFDSTGNVERLTAFDDANRRL